MTDEQLQQFKRDKISEFLGRMEKPYVEQPTVLCDRVQTVIFIDYLVDETYALGVEVGKEQGVEIGLKSLASAIKEASDD